MRKEIADLVIISGAMFRGVSPKETPQAGGVAIKDGKIAAVGPAAALEACAGPGTKVYRYGADTLLMPGFCDSHLHLGMTIAAENGPQLRFVASEEECVAITKQWLEDHPGVPWVVGNAWHHSNWPEKKPPNKERLSAAIPDVPVCLVDVDAHAAWLNQKALEVYGITKDTPDWEGGVVYRYPDGEPTGYIEETPCIDVFESACAAIFADPAARRAYLKHTCRRFNSRGITSVMDALETPADWLDTCEALQGSGELTVRVATTAFLNDNPAYLETGRALQARFPDKGGLLSFWGFKGLTDGVGGTRTAWMTEDYADAPGNRGYPVVNPDVLRERVLRVEEAGFGAHLHACGTRAVEFCLDVIEEAKGKGFLKGQRNTITHCDTVNDKDFPRFRALGVVASLQPEMLAPTRSYADNLYPIVFGEGLMKNGWANRRIFDNAPAVSFSSDSPVTVANPMHAVYRATQRVHDDGTPPGGINPAEKVSLGECLWAFTYGGAYQLGREDILGTLEAGKLADIVVLDKNPFKADPAEYRGIGAALTVTGGEVVYQKG